MIVGNLLVIQQRITDGRKHITFATVFRGLNVILLRVTDGIYDHNILLLNLWKLAADYRRKFIFQDSVADLFLIINGLPTELEVLMESDGNTNHLKVIARKPSRLVKSHKGYFVKGYKFHTRKHGDGRITNNCGVCVRGTTYNDEESDYFGLLDEVLEVDYLGSERCIVVLFKCTWFDNAQGVKVHQNKLIDIKPKSRLQTNDPFVLASQVEQVYYTPYPAVTRDTKDWWAVIKTKPRGIYEVSEDGKFEEHEDTNEEEEEEEKEEEEEEEESQDLEDTEDDEDELDLSDHTSDEDELDS
ncbi:hypothetical protein LXL04_030441 [Taraxacum kok-saghyz]